MSELRHFIVRAAADGLRPWAIYLPRPTPATFLSFVARNACRLPELSSRPVHLFGVSESGIPIATAILMHRQLKGLPGAPNDRLTIVDPEHAEHLPTEFDDTAVHIVVDNSLKSLHTLREVSYRLRSSNVSRSLLLKLVDYEDEIEAEQRDVVENHYGFRVLSIFDASDITSEAARRSVRT